MEPRNKSLSAYYLSKLAKPILQRESIRHYPHRNGMVPLEHQKLVPKDILLDEASGDTSLDNDTIIKTGIEPQWVEGPRINFKPVQYSDIAERVARVKEGLYRLAEESKRDVKELKRVADRITAEAHLALDRVIAGDDRFFEQSVFHRQILETIPVMDGSRPSYLVRKGEVEEQHTLGEDWLPLVRHSESRLKEAIACVGRIDSGGAHRGTGFLIQKDLIVTNRHVLEGISQRSPSGKRVLFPSAAIDFGCEYDCPPGLRRAIKDTVFYGAHDFNGQTNHSELDLAVLRVEPLPENVPEPSPLSLNLSQNWTSEDAIIYIIGYPAKPDRLQYPDLDSSRIIEIFFADVFGCKRCAPGRIEPLSVPGRWTACHDATTLGGNSGSLVVALDVEQKAAGLHYGGNLREPDPKVNWAHILGATFDSKDAQTNRTLRDILSENEILIA